MATATPQIRFASWKNNEFADPVGTRHLVSGAFAFDKVVGLGCDSAMTFRGLRLDLNAGETIVGSDVTVVNFCFPNFGDLLSSGITAVDNMRIWLPDGSGTVLGLPGAHLQYYTSTSWLPYFSFPSGAGQTLESSLPNTQNVTRIDGSTAIRGFTDTNVSSWIYFRLFLDNTFPVGTYGICGSGLLRIRLTYDFY